MQPGDTLDSGLYQRAFRIIAHHGHVLALRTDFVAQCRRADGVLVGGLFGERSRTFAHAGRLHPLVGQGIGLMLQQGEAGAGKAQVAAPCRGERLHISRPHRLTGLGLALDGNRGERRRVCRSDDRFGFLLRAFVIAPAVRIGQFRKRRVRLRLCDPQRGRSDCLGANGLGLRREAAVPARQVPDVRVRLATIGRGPEPPRTEGSHGSHAAQKETECCASVHQCVPGLTSRLTSTTRPPTLAEIVTGVTALTAPSVMGNVTVWVVVCPGAM